MAQTKEGAAKAKKVILERYGADHYRKIGSKGGSACVPKGFAMNRALASIAGARGGRNGFRGPAKKKEEE